jgi:hypothetical protein
MTLVIIGTKPYEWTLKRWPKRIILVVKWYTSKLVIDWCNGSLTKLLTSKKLFNNQIFNWKYGKNEVWFLACKFKFIHHDVKYLINFPSFCNIKLIVNQEIWLEFILKLLDLNVCSQKMIWSIKKML